MIFGLAFVWPYEEVGVCWGDVKEWSLQTGEGWDY
jgi:hypothetical protein